MRFSLFRSFSRFFLSSILLASFQNSATYADEFGYSTITKKDTEGSGKLCQSPDLNETKPVSAIDMQFESDHWHRVATLIINGLIGHDIELNVGQYPSISIFADKAPNAFASQHNHLTVSSGLLERIESSNELAFVLAHELGHIFLNHNSLPPPTTVAESLEREKAADQYALKLLQRSKIDHQNGARLLSRLMEAGLKEDNSTLALAYPTLRERFLALH